MPQENQQPQTPQTPPVQPPDHPPPSPPQPGEKKRISTAAANAPEQPAKPPQPRDPAGQYLSPIQPVTPVAPAAQPAPAAAIPPPPPAQPAIPPAQAAAPPTPKHPVWLSELAKTSGFTQEQIDRLDTNALGEGVRFAQARGLNQQQPQAPPPAAPVQSQAPPPPPEFDLGLTDDQKEEFGPELMGVLTKIGQATAQKTAALEQRLAQYEHREIQRSQVQVMNAVDMAITSLPPEYQQILGAGPGVEVMQTMPEVWERRRFVLESLQANGLNYQTASPAEIQARIKTKVDSHWGIKPAAPVNPPVVTKQQWDGFGSPPPTQRTGPDNLPARDGTKVEDRYNDALTDEEAEDERIRASLRRRKAPQPAT